MEEFVSEPVSPMAPFDTRAMARGEPGLPAGFTWRGEELRVVREIGRWKESSPEGGKPGGELYLRRHYYRLLMSDGRVWTLYFVRQPIRSGSAQQRWFLYTVAGPRPGSPAN